MSEVAPDLPTCRGAAKALGVTHYFNGKPCPKGHVVKRYTRNGACALCEQENSTRWKAKPENQERARLYSIGWRAADPVRAKESRDGYYARNRDKMLEVYRQYGLKNREARSVRQRNRKARLVAAGGKHSVQDIRDLVDIQKGRCAYCRVSIRKKHHVDHIVAISNGGHNGRSNLQITCVSCNVRKRTKPPEVFARERGFLI